MMDERPHESSQVKPPPADLFHWPAHWLCALVFGATLLAYLPALGGGFVWDDDAHVTRPELRSGEGLLAIWGRIGATQQYYPLLHSAFWLEYRLWGEAPAGYHAVNILLHAAAACLLGLGLRRLGVAGAGLAALLFALHPVCVESVAWISEQKNTLSTGLYLGAALAYLRFEPQRRAAWYAGATGLFVLALLTKSVTGTLPAALLIVSWWRRGHLAWRGDVLPLVPWFALGAAAGLMTAWVEHTFIGATGEVFALTVPQRGLLAGRAFWFYLGKLFWPVDLAFVYPRWTLDATVAWQYTFPVGALALLGGLALGRRRWRGLLAGLLFFAVSLAPALGFVNVYPFLFSYVADHFQYLACLGVLVPAAAGLALAFARLPPWAGRAAGAALLLALGVLTLRQSRMYRDELTLFEVTVAKNPASWMGHNNLGAALAAAGRPAEAIPHFEQALRLKPEYPDAENNLGHNLILLGRAEDALPHLRRALQLKPDFADAHNNLGVALTARGRAAEGFGEFQHALRLKPDYPLARYNVGLALATAGRWAEANAQFEAALRGQPNFPEAQLGWALALERADRLPEALAHFARALQLKPDYREAHLALALALRRAGRLREAQAHFDEAARLLTNRGPAAK